MENSDYLLKKLMTHLSLNGLILIFVIMKQLIILILALSTSVSGFAQLPNNVPTSGLKAWWSFNGNANDLSGNNNNGTVNGATLDTSRFGELNSAYAFNGSSYININNSTSLQSPTSAITITAWVYVKSWEVTSEGKWAAILCKSTSTSSTQYRLTLQDTAVDFIYGGKQTIFSIAPNKFELNKWYFVAVSSNINSCKIYINDSSYTNILPKNNYGSISNQNLEIGRDYPGTIDYFTGKIDDIGIWNRELTSSEITALYRVCKMSNVSIIPSGNTTFCQGNDVTLNSSLLGSQYTYSWLNNGNLIGSANTFSYITNQTGSFSLRVDSIGCSSTSSAIAVKVNPLPMVTASIFPFISVTQPSITLLGNPSGGFFSGKGILNNTFSPSIANVGSKSIKYNYTDTNGCSNYTTITTIVFDTIQCTQIDTVVIYDSISVMDTLIINTPLTGIPEPNNRNVFKVYPNPASSHLIIDNGNLANISNYKIVIINSTGQTVFSQNVNQQQFNIDLSTWTGRGIYFIQVVDSSNTVLETKKILIE
jgi:hypothetical protein